jgi:hypothetical protein
MNQIEDRLKHLLDSIQLWRVANPDLEIVICDGSGFDLTEHVRARLGAACRGVEIMCFTNNREKVRAKGKGYGEGEILRHALHSSEKLRSRGYFAKCTGKLFVRNYGQLVRSHLGALSVEKYYRGRYSLSYDSCDTRFYIASRDFYLRYLANCHESVNDHEGLYIEHMFADGVKRSGARLTDFKVKPLIVGYSGTKNLPLNTEPETRKRALFRLVRRVASSFVPVTWS